MSVCDKSPEKHRGSTVSIARFDTLGRILCNWCGLPDQLEPDKARLQYWKESAEREKERKRELQLEKERQQREFIPQETLNEWGLIQTKLSAWVYNMTTDSNIVKEKLNALENEMNSIHDKIKNNPQELTKWTKFKQMINMRLTQ